ncbi:hypothetical protein ACPCG0_14435 [Propionibacteriaceae bacterium Y1923]|uniref:hypothetical protein n=1 Tax=Aestuariimicrobium sp. Y1814 TaxID=3418742 RepID=UPI003C17F895
MAQERDEVLEALVDPEFAAAFERVAGEHHAAILAPLEQRLLLLQARGTPLRLVTRFSQGVARLQFADNTAVLINCDSPRRGIGPLGVAVARRRAILVTAVGLVDGRLQMRLRWDTHHVDVDVLGGDQAT